MNSTELPVAPGMTEHGPRFRKVWIITALYWIVMVIGTHIPNAAPPTGKSSHDKVLHVIGFALFSWLLAKCFTRPGVKLRPTVAVAIFVGVALYGVVDELTQPPFFRTREFFDWVADLVGAGLGLWIFTMVHKVARSSEVANPKRNSGLADGSRPHFQAESVTVDR